MYISAISFFSLVASLAYEQYGAAQKHKYGNEFDGQNFFSMIILLTIFVAVASSVFTINWIGGSLFAGIMLGINVAAINIGKQSLVHFQLSGSTSKYFLKFIVYKTLYFLVVVYASSRSIAIEHILCLLLLPNVFFAISVGLFERSRYVYKISVDRFVKDFSRIKFVYFTALITSLYSFIDLYIIYSKLDSAQVSTYNLAIQLNMAIAVIGQAYNVHVFSNKNKQTLSSLIDSMKKINFVILALSAVVITIVHSDLFLTILKILFAYKYEQLPSLILSTVWILPVSLVSMFYAPLWIVSEKYLILMLASISALLLFTGCAFYFIYLGIQGIIYAQYITGIYVIIENIAFYMFVRYKCISVKETSVSQ